MKLMPDLTPLPHLIQGAGLTGPTRTRRTVYVDLLPPCPGRIGYLSTIKQATRAFG
jgi:hypothetical protein